MPFDFNRVIRKEREILFIPILFSFSCLGIISKKKDAQRAKYVGQTGAQNMHTHSL